MAKSDYSEANDGSCEMMMAHHDKDFVVQKDNDKKTTEKLHKLLSVVTLALVVSVFCNLALLSATRRMATPDSQQLTGATSFLVHQHASVTASSSHNIEERQLQETDTGIVPATVTVVMDGITYRGNEDQPSATFRVDPNGCGVYEHIRNDGKEGHVACCGDGDCLLGFLTQHQWLLSWL